MLIEGERIVAVEPFGQFTAMQDRSSTQPAGHWSSTDGSARTCTCCCHPGRGLRTDRALGSRRFRHPGRREPSRLPRGRHRGGPQHVGQHYLEMRLRDAIAASHIPGPLLHCAGKHIIMTRGHVPQTARIADGPDEVRKATREQIGAGADHVKIMASGGVFSPHTRPQDSHLTRSRACRLRRGGAPFRQAGREPRDRRRQRAQRGARRRRFDRARFLDR